MFEGKRILVTGAGGLLGAALVERLKSAGVVDILAPTRAELDLTDPVAVSAYFIRHEPTYLFHLAAQVFGLGGNLAHQFSALSVNTAIDDAVFTAASKVPLRRIFFSGTVASYPYPYRRLPLQEDLLFEGMPHYGEFGYASAKRHALNYLVLLEKEHGIPYVYGLLTNLYGPGDKFDTVNGHVVPSLVRKIHAAKHAGTSLSVWGDGTAKRDFMYVTDAADAIVSAFHKLTGIVNIASGSPRSIRDVVNRLRDASRFAGSIEWQTDKPTGITDRSVCVSRLTEIGFAPSHTLSDGLQKTYEWYSTNFTRVRT